MTMNRTGNRCVVWDLFRKKIMNTIYHFPKNCGHDQTELAVVWLMAWFVKKTLSLWADHAVAVRAGPWQCGAACVMAQQRATGKTRAFVTLRTPRCAGHSLAC